MLTPVTIPQTNPKAGYEAHRAEIDAAVKRVLDSGWYILGREVEAFESEFAAFVGVPHALGVANGTDALVVALRACGVGPGDGVLTVSLTAVATVAAIELVGAVPVLVDIDPFSFTMAPDALEAAIAAHADKRLRAIVPVHLYGHMADMPALTAIAARHGLKVIEDCAQAHGAAIADRGAGSWGDVATFSFYPTKNLGALGDGGAIATADAGLAERARMLREYGWKERYISEIPGLNTRLDELQAAILRAKLPHLAADNARRRAIARRYDESLPAALARPSVREGHTHVYHQYVVRHPERDALQRQLRAEGIGALVHYPQAVHQQPAYAGRVATGPGGLIETELATARVLSLPMYPQLDDAQVGRVAEAIARWAGVGASPA